MPDNMNFRNNPDASRINVNETHELRYWTQALGCSAEELRDAVKKVGTSAMAVRNYINGNKGDGANLSGNTNNIGGNRRG
jgi:hypothetical protein